MKEPIKEILKVDYSKKSLSIEAFGIYFVDTHGYHIIYLPSLQMSSYGSNFEEADQLMRIQLDEYSNNLFKLSNAAIDAELKNLGWIQDKFFKKRFSIELSETTYDDIRKEYEIPDSVEFKNVPVEM